MKKQLKAGEVVPQFNINNLEWTRYILEACNDVNSPVILGVSEGAIKHMGGYETVVGMVKGLISDLNITIPVSIHLDHGSSLESCSKAIQAGFTSVMLDNSKLPLEQNILNTKLLIDLAYPNVMVETEVGQVGGIYASVEDCVMMSELNIDALAVAIGNCHGQYSGEVMLDLELLDDIKRSTNKALVLHGASGIPDNLLGECVKRGINKVNFNTELQLVWNDALRKYIKENESVYDPRKIISAGEVAIKNKVIEKIRVLNGQ